MTLEEMTIRALKMIDNGTVPPIPDEIARHMAIIAMRNPDLVAQTREIVRRARIAMSNGAA